MLSRQSRTSNVVAECAADSPAGLDGLLDGATVAPPCSCTPLHATGSYRLLKKLTGKARPTASVEVLAKLASGDILARWCEESCFQVSCFHI